MDELSASKETFRSWGVVNPHLLRYIIPRAYGRVLDVGCGRGGYVRVLAERYEAYGCDLFQWPEWKAQQRVRFLQADVTHLPFADRSFNLILALNVLEHIGPIQDTLRELKRVASEYVILSVPNCQIYPEMEWAGLSFFHWVDRSHRNFFDSRSLREILEEEGFQVEILQPFGNVRPEILLLRSLRLPMLIARGIAWVLQKLPWRKRYAPSLLVIARSGGDGAR